jgi:hypothetical protein
MLLWVTPVHSQQSIPSEQRRNLVIRGRVTDSTGATVPGVDIRAAHTESEIPELTSTVYFYAVTDERGDYSFPPLKPRKYVISIGLAGFTSVSKEVLLGTDAPNAVDFVLTAAPVSAPEPPEVQVETAKSLIEELWGIYVTRRVMLGVELLVALNLSLDEPRRKIIRQLYEFGQEAVAELAVTLKGPEGDTRRFASWTLWDLATGVSFDPPSKLDIRYALPALIIALGDSWADVRISSAEAVAEIGPAAKDALPALRKALEDPSEQVRTSVQRAIATIQN